MIKVRIPDALRALTGRQGEVEVKGTSVGELIDNLNAQYAGLKDRLCDAKGDVRRFVNIYVNGEDIRFLKGKETALKDGDEVSIVPAIAGGQEDCYAQASLSYPVP
jgi:molybdopterin synthase sulfur carrier subunit